MVFRCTVLYQNIERSNGNSKQFWSVVKKIINKKQYVLSAISVNYINLEVYGNEKVVGDCLNDYFVSIIERLKHESFDCDLFQED